jgi:TRAP-type mannitol/chloroaromatic compound transport system permease small subunit
VRELLFISQKIDAFNAWLGRWLSWLIVAVVLVSAINAVVRKVFNVSSNAYLELQWVLFSVIFLLCSPWTLLNGEHIRIDIVNHMLPLKVRGWIDVIGHVLFLLPFTLLLLYLSVPFFLSSYRINEQSSNAGGLPQWPAKSLIMIAMALLLAQGVSELIKRIAMMRGLIPDSNAKSLTAHEIIEQDAERMVADLNRQ